MSKNIKAWKVAGIVCFMLSIFALLFSCKDSRIRLKLKITLFCHALQHPNPCEIWIYFADVEGNIAVDGHMNEVSHSQPVNFAY